ncbi:MAG: LysE family translocator, partial [Paracoccaceae bacterium]
MSLSAFVAVWFVHLLAAISPGPAVLLAARTAMKSGMAKGCWLAAGIGLGACIWAVAALLGLSLLFKIAPWTLSVLRIGGALYLMWLALKLWRHAADPLEQPGPAAAMAGDGPLALVWLGIATQLANPKPAVFFGAVFLNFIPPHSPLWALMVVLGLVFFNDAGWNV